MPPMTPAGKRAPPDLTGKPRDVVSSESERMTGIRPGLLLASGESKGIISTRQKGPSRQLKHVLQVHSPELVRSTETTLQVGEHL